MLQQLEVLDLVVWVREGKERERLLGFEGRCRLVTELIGERVV